MSRAQPRNQTTPVTGGATRQNEYFVPRDGIDREVISADICRYLGNDALVRPGHYENPQTGQVVQGYYITGYRNLTTAMIEDLKADSARWDNERRAQTSRNTPGGSFASRDAAGFSSRHSSNSPIVQYRHSEIHQSRQHHGPTEGPPFQQDPYARDAGYDGPRYPGSGAPGFSGASGNYPPQGSYAPSSGGGGYGFQQSQVQQSPPPDPRYGGSGFAQSAPPMDQRFANPDNQYVHTGANLTQSRGGFPQNDYSGNRIGSSGAPQQPVYATAPPSQPGYAAATSPYQYPGQVGLPTSGAQSFATMHPQDGAFGRASPAGQTTAGGPPQGFPAQGQQYEDSSTKRSSLPPQTPAASNAHRSDRDGDRHPSTSDRHHRQPRR